MSVVAVWAGFIYWKFRIPHKINFAQLEVVSLQGKHIQFSELIRNSDKPVIVMFGQSWCHDCHAEMLQLDKARSLYFPNHRVLVVSDEDLRTMSLWQRDMHLPYEYYHLPQDLEVIGVFAYPTTYIVGKNHDVVFSHVGSIAWEGRQMHNLLAD